MASILPQNIFCACQTLFGTDIPVTPEFLDDLQPSGLKTAFRKRALESHPDRANFLDATGRDLHEEFLSVRNAYELLNHYLCNPQPHIVTCYTTATADTKKNKTPNTSAQSGYASKAQYSHTTQRTAQSRSKPSDFHYSGRIPQRKLLFGEFLYYSGIISWKTLVHAVTWQRMQRPKLGQIAIDLGILSKDDVAQILAHRPWHEKFGEFAVRTGYLNSANLEVLVQTQRRLHGKIGSYFTSHRLLATKDLYQLLNKHKMHNLQK